MGRYQVASDAELLAATPYDVEAFEALYRRYVGRVMAFAAKRCACAADVADVVAQTFVRLLRAAERYEPERGEPAAFVFGVAHNVLRDLQRRTSRQQALVAKLAGRDLLDDDEAEGISAAIDAARAAPVVNDAIAAVPFGEQEMLRLVADGRTPSEAAHALGISPAAGRQRLSRARRRVRGLIDRDPCIKE